MCANYRSQKSLCKLKKLTVCVLIEEANSMYVLTEEAKSGTSLRKLTEEANRECVN